MLAVPGHESESVLQCRGSDERVGKSNSELPSDPTGSFSDRTVDREFSEGREQLARQVRGGVAGEELCAGHDRVVQPMPAWDESGRATEMVDENVSIDQEIRHAATRRATERPHLEPRRTWPQVLSSRQRHQSGTRRAPGE